MFAVGDRVKPTKENPNCREFFNPVYTVSQITENKIILTDTKTNKRIAVDSKKADFLYEEAIELKPAKWRKVKISIASDELQDLKKERDFYDRKIKTIENLKPCPFCGKQPIYREYIDDRGWWHLKIGCCGVVKHLNFTGVTRDNNIEFDMQTAVKKWNKRIK